MNAATIDLGTLAVALADATGMPSADAHRGGDALAEAAALIGPRTNRAISWRTAANLGLPAELSAATCRRKLPPPRHPGGMPSWFHAESHCAVTDAVRLVRICDGYLLHLAETPVVLTAPADMVVRDVSGRYAPLINHVEIDPTPILRAARRVRGAVFVLGDEIVPVNYCHWLLDALPRLHALRRLGPRHDVSVAVLPLTAGFQRETLHLCGFDDAQIIELGPMQALQADELLATSDLPDPPHPAFKASAWAVRFLRDRLGGAAVTRGRRRLYVSRADSGGRCVLNEAELLRALEPLGFEQVRLTGMTVREQAALFRDAAFIVGPHGAGLANAVFAPRGARLLELFPRTYGMASYYILAAGIGLHYAYLIAGDVVTNKRPQLHDMRVDVGQVVTACQEMLR